MKIHDANDARRPVCINLPMRARMEDFLQSAPLVSLVSCGETPDHPPTASCKLSVTVSRTVENGQQTVNER